MKRFIIDAEEVADLIRQSTGAELHEGSLIFYIDDGTELEISAYQDEIIIELLSPSDSA